MQNDKPIQDPEIRNKDLHDAEPEDGCFVGEVKCPVQNAMYYGTELQQSDNLSEPVVSGSSAQK